MSETPKQAWDRLKDAPTAATLRRGEIPVVQAIERLEVARHAPGKTPPTARVFTFYRKITEDARAWQIWCDGEIVDWGYFVPATLSAKPTTGAVIGSVSLEELQGLDASTTQEAYIQDAVRRARLKHDLPSYAQVYIESAPHTRRLDIVAVIP